MLMIVLPGDDCSELERLKGKLAKEFEIKDLGGLKYFCRNQEERIGGKNSLMIFIDSL